MKRQDVGKLLLFDFDGVLADSTSQTLRCTKQAAASIGHECEPTLEILRSLKRMEFEAFAERLGIAHESIPRFVEAAYKELTSGSYAPSIYDGMAGVVKELSKEALMGIVTGSVSGFVQRFLEAHGLGTEMSFIMGIDHPGSKVEKIGQLLKRTGRSPQGTWMIGDAVSDVEAAKAAGVKSVAVSWGYQDIRLLQASAPDHVVNSPDELLWLLK